MLALGENRLLLELIFFFFFASSVRASGFHLWPVCGIFGTSALKSAALHIPVKKNAKTVQHCKGLFIRFHRTSRTCCASVQDCGKRR